MAEVSNGVVRLGDAGCSGVWLWDLVFDSWSFVDRASIPGRVYPARAKPIDPWAGSSP